MTRRSPVLVVEPAPVEPELELVPPEGRAWFRPRRALRTLRTLIDDPERTENAVEVFYAIGTGDFERIFRRFAARPDGRRLLARRPVLLTALQDRAALSRLPEPSLGRAYLAYLERTGFAADGLLAVEERVRRRWEVEEGVRRLDPARAWFRDRSMLVHDLAHVLTGYGTDELGEATLLAFDWAQAPGFANGLLTVGASLEVWRHLGRRWPGYVAHAFRRGRRARWLVTLPFEELLGVAAETVRSLAGIEPLGVAHPEGVLRGTLRAAA